MRILQLIDSLDAGGAERMAVNYANALAAKIEFSGLAATRKQGPLLNQIQDKVSYLFLDKKRVFDIKALRQLRKFVKENKIEIVHAHSTSFFTAFLLKLICPTIKLIWHDHYGDSEFLSKRPSIGLKVILLFFSGIIAVNQHLKKWAEQKLHFKNVINLPNFPAQENRSAEQTILQGIEGRRIVSLANLRVQKNHFLLLEVAKIIRISHPDWTFHLVGKDFEDEYSKQIKRVIFENSLEKNVFLYGSRQDVKNILDQASIGILTSQSEGLPLALLEYGLYGKPAVVSDVGEIPLVIKDGVNGVLVKSGNKMAFINSLIKLIENESLREIYGNELQKTIFKNYSENAVIQRYLYWLEKSTND